MSDPNHITVDPALLGKYLSGEATPEESMAAGDWISASAENRKQFEQIQAVWQQVSPGETHQLPGKENVWKEIVRLRLAAQGPGIQEDAGVRRETEHPVSRFRLPLVMAACLLFVVGMLTLRSLPGRQRPVNIVDRSRIVNTPYINRTADAGILPDTLPDQSIVIQNNHSRLGYHAEFTDTNREISLTGEAWLNVRPDPNRPFIIHVGNIRIKVLGTSFNIRQTDSFIETSVQSGSVLMCNAMDTILVKTGQEGSYNVTANQFQVADHFNENSLGYATRVLNFDNASLTEIAASIEKAYGITVVFRDKKLKMLTMSSSFDNNTVKYVFDVIAATLNIKYKIENKTVYISAMENN